jgi:flavin reductase (DIM6/NTAB) family NADH-FMN oxidoreductase RutF
MFYDPDIKGDHGLPHDPFKSCVVPRPIGWISTVSADGVNNLAPYSNFNAVAHDPHYLMFAASNRHDGPLKHSWANAEATGSFVFNMASAELAEPMNISAAIVDEGVDEFKLSGLTAVASERIAAPRVKEALIAMECEYWKTIELPRNDESRRGMIIGHVVGIHIDESILTDGLVDVAKLKPLARLGYFDYTIVESRFEMRVPKIESPGNPKAA